MTPEEQARANIDNLLGKAGWQLFNVNDANIYAGRGVAVREFPLNRGHGAVDYLLYLDGGAVGVIEAKKEGTTLKGVEKRLHGCTTKILCFLKYGSLLLILMTKNHWKHF